jgi:hypothetical protein
MTLEMRAENTESTKFDLKVARSKLSNLRTISEDVETETNAFEWAFTNFAYVLEMDQFDTDVKFGDYELNVTRIRGEFQY